MKVHSVECPRCGGSVQFRILAETFFEDDHKMVVKLIPELVEPHHCPPPKQEAA